MSVGRRRLGSMLGLGMLAAGRAAPARQAGKPARIGWIGFLDPHQPEVASLLAAFWQGMKELGLVEGRDVVAEYRWAQGSLARNPELAADLVRLGVDLIIAGNAAAVRACRALTATIPIVCFNLADPVSEGLAASLGRPGGNVTGMTILAQELVPKQLSLLFETVPRARRIAGLWQPGMQSEAVAREMLESAQRATEQTGRALRLYPARDESELESALAAMGDDWAEALLIMPSPLSLLARERVGAFTTARRLPTMGWIREFVQVGALMSYGVDFHHQYRRGATYVVRILRGADPATLPIEQPTQFELAINLKVARSLGVSVPVALLAQTNERDRRARPLSRWQATLRHE